MVSGVHAAIDFNKHAFQAAALGSEGGQVVEERFLVHRGGPSALLTLGGLAALR